VPDHADTLYAVATDTEATMTTVAVYNMSAAWRDGRRVSAATGRADLPRAQCRPRSSLKKDPLRQGRHPKACSSDREAATLMALVREDGVERGLMPDHRVGQGRAFRFYRRRAGAENRAACGSRAFAERDKEDSADLAAEYIRNFTQQEPIPGITYEYGLVQRFVPEIGLDDVNKVAKDWAGGSRVVLVNGPRKPGLVLPDSTRLAAVIKSAAQKDIRPYVDAVSSQSLLDRAPQPGTVVKTTTKTSFGLIEWELSNGARVVLAPTRFKQDEVVFRATSPGGTSLASDKDYVAAMTAGQVIGAGGVGNFDAIQLRNALSAKAASVTAFIDETEEGLAGGASPKDLETLFQLIYLTFTQPRADPAVFGAMEMQMKAMLANRQSSPEWAFRQTLQTTLAQNHYRSRPMTPEMVDEMDLQKSFAFYKDRLADASDFTFVFAGSFDPSAMRPLVEQYLATLPSLRRNESWKDVGITPPKGVVEKTVRKGIEPKSEADIVFTGPFSFDSPHRVALDALGLVLERRLRETCATSWADLRRPGGGRCLQDPQSRYDITIGFGCDPERTEELVKTLFREIDTLKAKGPAEKEVSDAREALLREHETALAQNSLLVAEISARYEVSEDPQEFFDLPRAYEKLTSAAVQDAARTYLDTNNYVRVTLYPEKMQRAPIRDWEEALDFSMIPAFIW
jgi:zinc protease